MRIDSKIKPEMEKTILEFYKTKTRQEIADLLGNDITPYNVQDWLKRRNLFVKKNMFSDQDIEYMRLHYNDMSYKDIGDKLGFTERQIRGKINNMGLSKIRKFNDTYFSIIDTPNKAYFLGLIFADGWVVNNTTLGNYELGLQLQSQDKYILTKFNNELGGVHSINHINKKEKYIKGIKTVSGEQDTIRVYSKRIVNDLISLNVIPNKTKEKVHPIVPNDLFFDFLRGYIDGDGCYYCYKNNFQITITCANKEPLEWILKVLKQNDINVSIYKEYDSKYRLYCFKSLDVKCLINKMYYESNVICLSRKYNKIKSFLTGFTV